MLTGLPANAATFPASGAVSLRERLAYGLGDFAVGLYWQTIMVYLTFFYTDVFGLSALAAGAMLGLSRSLDALLDPAIGAVADRTRTRWGTFRPYLLWLGLPLAVAGTLAFTVPDAPGIRVVWAWVTFNLMMLLFAAISIPYTALLAVISPSPAERTRLSSVKFVFAFAAGMLVSAGVLPLCRMLGAGDAARGWQRCFILIGAVSALCFAVTFAHTHERVDPPRERHADLRGELRGLFGNGPWLLLMAFNLVFTTCQAVRGSVLVHYFKYYVGAQSLTLPEFLPKVGGARVWQLEELVAAFNTSGGIASVCGVLLVPAFARVVGRKRAFVSLLAVTLASALAVYWVRPDQVEALFWLNLLGTFVGAPISVLLWTMFADTVDYAEWKTERRSTGLVFATLMFAGKQGWALGAALSLGLLSRFGFVANAEQTPASLHGLQLLVSVVPAALGAVALGLIAFYPLDDARLAQLAVALDARRRA
ncbi:MAG TPA: MFS transporter [Polyangiaceae bacterium]|nr:MFS transporter [Polyangiaceae bacterium]